jgi:hypothetical protein
MGRRLLSVALLLLLAHPLMFGGALFPAVKGAISKNGEFVVLVDFELDNSESTISRIKKIYYHVQRRERFINYSFHNSNSYWSESVGWKIAIPQPQQMGVPLPVVSDDGNTIVLLAVNPAQSKEMEAIRIYRKKGSGEELVGAYRLQDIWSPEELHKQVVMTAIDGRPLWLDGSSFEFSPDSHDFVIRTATGRIVRIGVENGTLATVEDTYTPSSAANLAGQFAFVTSDY